MLLHSIGSILLTLITLQVNTCCVATNIFCDQAFECANESIFSTLDEYDYYFRGLGSFAFGNLTLTSQVSGYDSNVYCEGKRSCQELKYMEVGELPYFDGYLSVAWSNYVYINAKNWQYTYCKGEASCYKTVFQLHQWIKKFGCYGMKSCSNINNLNAFENAYFDQLEFQSYATYSLLNTSVETYGKVTYLMYGFYDSINSTITCGDEQKCTIKCKLTGCANLNFECDTSKSICIVECDELNNHSCPNDWSYDPNTQMSYYIHDSNHKTNLIYGNRSYTTVLNQIESMTGEDDDDNLINLLSLLNSTYIKNNFYDECTAAATSTDSSLVIKHNCDDAYSCYNMTMGIDMFDNINNSIHVCCSGVSSCSNFIVNTNMDMNAMNSNDINTAVTVYCDGVSSCDSAQFMMNNSRNLNSNMYNDYTVYVRSYLGMSYSRIDYFNTVIATSSYGISNCIIRNSKMIGCYGYRACSNTKIVNVETIYATGYQSLYHTTIYSDGTQNVSIYLLGYDCAYNLNIICTDNQVNECKIVCLHDESCTNMITTDTTTTTITPIFITDTTTSTTDTNINHRTTTTTATTTAIADSGDEANKVDLLKVIGILCGIAIGFCIILAGIYYIWKRKKRKNQFIGNISSMSQTLLSSQSDNSNSYIKVRNPVVVILGIGAYDKNNLDDLLGVKFDYQNVIDVFTSKWNYKTFYYKTNDNFKLHWTKDEIDQFFNEAKKNVIDNNHDGLICCISCHGNKYGQILDSKGKPRRLRDIYQIFNTRETEQIPKLFVIDACRGSFVGLPIKNEMRANFNSSDDDNNEQRKLNLIKQSHLKNTENKENKENKENEDGQENNQDVENRDSSKELNSKHIYKLFATADGFASRDDPTGGGFLIQNFTNQFKNVSKIRRQVLTDIMQTVMKETHKNAALSFMDQMPETAYRMDKDQVMFRVNDQN